jgi:hypothetical protein
MGCSIARLAEAFKVPGDYQNDQLRYNQKPEQTVSPETK